MFKTLLKMRFLLHFTTDNKTLLSSDLNVVHVLHFEYFDAVFLGRTNKYRYLDRFRAILIYNCNTQHIR